MGARVSSAVTVPAEWPLMLVEIFVASDGAILMSSVLGVPKSCVKAFFAQGAYVYPFEELQEAISMFWTNTLRRRRTTSGAR